MNNTQIPDEWMHFLNEKLAPFNSDILINWHGDRLHAKSGKGEKTYMFLPAPARQKTVPEDAFYIMDDRPEYDIHFLAERITGDLVQPDPRGILGGHAVRLAKGHTWWGFNNLEDEMALVTGACEKQNPKGISMVFSSSGFRGGVSRYHEEFKFYTTCCGGPCPRYIAPEEFEYTGEYIEVSFWRWRITPEKNGGEYYFLKVPMWSWKSSN